MNTWLAVAIIATTAIGVAITTDLIVLLIRRRHAHRQPPTQPCDAVGALNQTGQEVDQTVFPPQNQIGPGL